MPAQPRPGYHLCFVDSLRAFGGAEVWILDTARALRARGHEVSAVVQPDALWLPRLQAALDGTEARAEAWSRRDPEWRGVGRASGGEADVGVDRCEEGAP